MQTLLEVDGMSCQHCENRITKYVGGTPGVSSVSVDLRAGTVEIEHDASVTAASIRAGIEELGYTVR